MGIPIYLLYLFKRGFKMEITFLKLFNFRNFVNLELKFSKYRNIIIGDNGSGKTNIVEAIFVLALTKSFRTNDDSVMIKENNNLFKIEGNVKSTFVNDYKIIYQNEEKIVKINNNKINKLSDYISNINIVSFSLNDLKLIKDTPSTRRKLINLEISQLDNNYIRYLNIYNKIIKQRNNYLKKLSKNTINYEYLKILDNQLIDYGIKIMNIRKDYIDIINTMIKDIYKSIGGSIDIHIKYISDFLEKNKKEIENEYNLNLKKDITLGSTQFGIHKDDFIFYKDDIEYKNFASEGQQKSAIIAFKLAELEVVNNKKGNYPILILDDLFSELDIKTVEKILNYINNDVQIFITTTDLNKIKKKFLKNTKVFLVKNGEVEEKIYE